MDDSEIWELIAKQLSQDCSAEEEAELVLWLSSSEENQRQYDDVMLRWVESKREVDPERLARGKALVFQRIEQDNNQRNIGQVLPSGRWKTLFVFSGVAAALLLIVLSWFFSTENKIQGQSADLKRVENSGEPIQIILPDGSKIWLNRGAEVRYSEAFSGKTREIFLDGEAFFQVKRDESKPFIVHAGSLTTRVLGTSFNVKAYSERSGAEVTVSSGKVLVSDSTGVIGNLVKDEQLSYEKATKKFTRQSVNSVNTALWKEGELIFDAENFGEVAQILERRYHVHIQFDDNTIKNYPISARFSKEESLQQIFYMLGLVTNTESIFDGRISIRIRRKNTKNNVPM
ncbi:MULTISPECIES: FecR family protein [Sphingobacterium]|uniref:FecR family protein n=1 Tax=Sphingobacterium TaxID=28453 RepID=UPI000E918790|nr:MULTISPECIES: FecR domain-containing protein [Sphingobacterium]HAE67074.1 hypothetical protein [Sphingobacterium sp.]HBI88871.1 hypothetical protein [Sphingobacterium sp.]